MKIHELVFLPARSVLFVDSGSPLLDQEVSLYGHWMHVRFGGEHGLVRSYPASRVSCIEWT